MNLNLDVLNEYYLRGLLLKKNHPTLPLTLWTYSKETYFSGYWDDITINCRGLVTNNNTGEIVAKPFKKFFNIEEQKHVSTTEFDVYEKVDGSLIILFNFEGQWITATTGSFESDHAIISYKILCQTNIDKLFINYTYLLEFTSPNYRIVIDYGPADKLTLLAAINTSTGLEMNYDDLVLEATKIDCETVLKYNGVSDYNLLKKLVRDDSEGFVVRFSNGERVKVKGENYIRLHRIVTNISTTSIWDQLRNCESMEDILTNIPDEFYDVISNYITQLMNEYYDLIYKNRLIFDELKGKHGDNKKDFALDALKYDDNVLLFDMYNNRNSNDYIFRKLKPEFKLL